MHQVIALILIGVAVILIGFMFDSYMSNEKRSNDVWYQLFIAILLVVLIGFSKQQGMMTTTIVILILILMDKLKSYK